MNRVGRIWWGAIPTAALVVGALMSGSSSAAPAESASGQYLVFSKTAAGLPAVKGDAVKAGARVVDQIPQLNAVVIDAPTGVAGALQRNAGVDAVSEDGVRTLNVADKLKANLDAPGLKAARSAAMPSAAAASEGATGAHPLPQGDPGLQYPGLLWNYPHIGAGAAWQTTRGSSEITVGVADTGLDFTHVELKDKLTGVVDLTHEHWTGQSVCRRAYGISDGNLAWRHGGPPRGDWNGHGTWIGGNIAAAVNGTGMNGIAPGVNLVSLKISQWCGSAYDSSMLKSFIYAADNDIDIVSISFGGYVDRRVARHDRVYKAYARAVQYAKARGTVIVSSAGNEAARIGPGGKVLSHGFLTLPGSEPFDPYGYYGIPAGVPGVVNVSATNNITVGPSASCRKGTTGSTTDPSATCKPASDRHQPTGIGKKNQLAYYSNYGPRIDIAAPGGAVKFNLPVWDRGGTPGFPYTLEDGTTVFEVFSTTSNWSVSVPCFTFPQGSGFTRKQCYSSIQGTSMATPHVSAAIALMASAHPGLRGNVDGLVSRVKAKATPATNYTQSLSARDKSKADLYGIPCPSGYCHLGGPRIPSDEAYGAGVLNIADL